MDKKGVKNIMDNCLLPDSCENIQLIETHISWIILTQNFAFKIKRPVKFSFLDFSTREKREHFCHEELQLNKRLEPEMYINVLPVTEKDGIVENETNGETIDFALKMKRMDNRFEMDKLLTNNKVSSQHIDKLAKKIARFHKEAKVVKNAFRTLDFHEKYADIQKQSDFIEEKLGKEYSQNVEKCIQKSFEYLNSIRNFSNDRVISGFQRDCHGDLNARNIFLYDEPVVFDCIEFNSEYRQIDVLNDIAFLCVDLDFYGKNNLSDEFYRRYLEYSEMKDEPEVRQLFLYYKSYRANVRAKVTLISAAKKGNDNSNELNDAKKFIELMAKYLELKKEKNETNV